MKKIFALLLALCLLLSAVPVLAEDFSGLWNVVLADVNLGTFQLNEDGTVDANLVGAGEAAGTWSAEGDSVTITLDDEVIVFSWDGATLFSPDLMFPVIREEGKISYKAVDDYMADNSILPEGMTAEDMEAAMKNFNAEYQKLMTQRVAASINSNGEEGAPSLDIIAENFYVMESYSGYRAVWVAKVMNTNLVPVQIRDGSLVVTDAEGTNVASASYLSTQGSVYLEPGEITFLSMEADVPANGEYTYTRSVEVRDNPYRKDSALTASDSDFSFGVEEYDSSIMQATVTNDSEIPVTAEIVFCLSDAEGTPWVVDETSLYRHELTPGSSIILKQIIDNRVVSLLKEKGIEITTVEAYAWTEIID